MTIYQYWDLYAHYPGLSLKKKLSKVFREGIQRDSVAAWSIGEKKHIKKITRQLLLLLI